MNNLWIYLSILACLITALKVIIYNKISIDYPNNYIPVFIIYSIAGLISIICLFFSKHDIKKIEFTPNFITFLVAAAIIKLSAILLVFKILPICPNISYAHSIINLNIIITVLASFFLFHQKLNNLTVFGMTLSLIGILIVVNNS